MGFVDSHPFARKLHPCDQDLSLETPETANGHLRWGGWRLRATRFVDSHPFAMKPQMDGAQGFNAGGRTDY